MAQSEAAPSFEDTDQLLGKFAQQEAVTYLDLVPIMRAYSVEHGVLIHGCKENGGDGHWNTVAHRIAAEAIYEFLYDKELIP